MIEGWAFNPPPHWPAPPPGWTPPAGWRPDPEWGPVPPGWQLWVPDRPAPRRPGVLVAAGAGAVLAITVVGGLVPRAERSEPVAGPGPVAVRAALPGPTGTPTPRASSPDSRPSPSTRPPSGATAPRRSVKVGPIRTFSSCRALRRVYPHGVGLRTAIDRAAGRKVTGFGRSTALYTANRALDGDGDHIACERP